MKGTKARGKRPRPKAVIERFLEWVRASHDGNGEEPPLTMDGFDDCILGVMRRFGQSPDLIVYDQEKVLATLMAQGMDREEAAEYFEFNQVGAWMGPGTPGFLTRVEDAPC